MSTPIGPELADQLWEAALEVSRDRRPVILIDGGSGSGKTSLACIMAERAPVPVHLISLDEVYPGWSGLAEASRILAEEILAETSSYRRWDWHAETLADRVAVDPERALIVEGCGALTLATAGKATFTIFLSVPEELRKFRAILRDGELYAGKWDMWAMQEREHWRKNCPSGLADIVLAW